LLYAASTSFVLPSSTKVTRPGRRPSRSFLTPNSAATLPPASARSANGSSCASAKAACESTESAETPKTSTPRFFRSCDY
jgi:hypothetical protein